MYCLWCHTPFIERTNWQYLFGLSTTTQLCQQCSTRLVKITGDICDKCGRPFRNLEPKHREGNLCIDCVRWGEGALAKNRSLYVYNEFLQEVIAKWKFRGDAELTKLFTTELQQLAKSFGQIDAIVPIPLSAERLYERGFNQSKLLAEQIEFSLLDALAKPIHLPKQSKKSRKERIQQENQFQITKAEITNKTILLVDDIYTTGATLYAAAEILKKHGANAVYSITVARS